MPVGRHVPLARACRLVNQGLQSSLQLCSWLRTTYAGDEITISYLGSLSDAVHTRQQSLQRGWQFTCCCPRCTVEAALPHSAHNIIATIHQELDQDHCRPGGILAQHRQGCTSHRLSCLSLLCTPVERLVVSCCCGSRECVGLACLQCTTGLTHVASTT